MSIFDTIHKRKAASKTLIIMLLLFISFYFIGMTYMDPPIEKGIEIVMNDQGAEINYGTSDNGGGEVQPMTNVTPQNSEYNTAPSEEAVLNQDIEDVPIVKPKTNPKPKETKPKEIKPTTPTPDKSTSDALNNILGAPSNTSNNSTSDGDETGKGDKGKIDGNPYATAYYGGGSGTGTGFGLNGRTKTYNQKYTQECEEEGIVVVKIEVDNSGKVINAYPGVKGSTNTAACLMEPAKRTALSYRFNADAKAPARQIGFVVVKFKLGQ